MQPMIPMQPPKRFPLAKRAMQRASLRLSRNGNTLTLALSMLFSVMVAFTTYLFCAVLMEILYGLTMLELAVCDLIYYVALVLSFALLALPLFVGRIRLAGLACAGEGAFLSELFYYYTSPRRFARSLLIGLIYPLCLLVPPFFSAVALAVGRESISPFAALLHSARLWRTRLREVFCFWLRVLWHLILSALTLGVLWVVYYAHHTTMSYWELIRARDRENG